MSEDPQTLHPVPIPGARPEAAHPLQRIWRGVAEVTEATLQALWALSEIFRPRYDDTDPARPPGRRRRRGAHPVEKSAPFPIND